MSGISIGLDIGGTKIAAAAFDAAGRELGCATAPTPDNYKSFLDICRDLVAQLEQKNGRADTIGACAPYFDENVNANIPILIGQNAKSDLQEIFGRPVPWENDANCAALAEAMEGAGKGYTSVFGLIMGTGIGGGFVNEGRVFTGANGLCGEVGHLPLPYYEESDGERVACGCGQAGCIEKLISGGALARLHLSLTGTPGDARQVAERARAGEVAALQVLDRYYEVVAKAMVTILHTFDPAIITVSGGLNTLPGLYDEVPKRWGRYALRKTPATKLVPAMFGTMAGLRGAAWVGKGNPLPQGGRGRGPA